jgi:hypothetical protein
MASFQKFNAFTNNLANGGVKFSTDTLDVMLTNTAPVATNSVYGDISGTELANGNGYTTGGTQATLVSSGQTSGTYKLVLNNVVFTATGSMGPFRYAVLYSLNTSFVTKPLVGFWDYGSSLTLANTDTFTVSFDATNGVLQIA